MKRSALLPLAIMAVLAGCSRTDIDTLKAQVVPMNPTYTFGQAFDTRKVCAATTWAESADERGRKIVEYRCTIKGVDDYAKADSANARKTLQDAAQREKDRYGDDLKLLQAGVAEAKVTLANARTAASTGTISTPANPEARAIAASLEILQSGDTDAILAHDYGPRYTDFTKAIADYKASKGGANITVITRCCRTYIVRTDPTIANNTKFAAAKQAAIQLMSSDIAELQQRRQVEGVEDLGYQATAIQNYQDKIDRMTAGQAAAFAAIDARLRAQLNGLDHNPLTGVDEVFRWLVADRVDPNPIYAGVQMHYADASVQDHEYDYTERTAAINAIVGNQSMDYTQFKQQQAAPAPIQQVAQQGQVMLSAPPRSRRFSQPIQLGGPAQPASDPRGDGRP